MSPSSPPHFSGGNRRDFGEIGATFVNILAVFRDVKTIVCE
jgi:hypothetical protein